VEATHNPPAEVRTILADLLRCAALYLSRHRWTQGDYCTPVFNAVTPPACAWSAPWRTNRAGVGMPGPDG
jgi:hypothetical protein